MSMTYCKHCDVRFDTDATEQAIYCLHCKACMPLPIETPLHRNVRWTIRPAIGERAIWEMDVTLKLAWDELQGWTYDGVIVDDIDGHPMRIDRDGTMLIDNGWHQHSALAKVLAMTAEHVFDRDRQQITADLPSYWLAPDYDYTDSRYRRLAV